MCRSLSGLQLRLNVAPVSRDGRDKILEVVPIAQCLRLVQQLLRFTEFPTVSQGRDKIDPYPSGQIMKAASFNHGKHLSIFRSFVVQLARHPVQFGQRPIKIGKSKCISAFLENLSGPLEPVHYFRTVTEFAMQCANSPHQVPATFRGLRFLQFFRQQFNRFAEQPVPRFSIVWWCHVMRFVEQAIRKILVKILPLCDLLGLIEQIACLVVVAHRRLNLLGGFFYFLCDTRNHFGLLIVWLALCKFESRAGKILSRRLGFPVTEELGRQTEEMNLFARMPGLRSASRGAQHGVQGFCPFFVRRIKAGNMLKSTGAPQRICGFSE
ncbi:MAG: hypothetical protein ACRERU_05115 [Methylococcales bacterium]